MLNFWLFMRSELLRNLRGRRHEAEAKWNLAEESASKDCVGNPKAQSSEGPDSGKKFWTQLKEEHLSASQ